MTACLQGPKISFPQGFGRHSSFSLIEAPKSRKEKILGALEEDNKTFPEHLLKERERKVLRVLLSGSSLSYEPRVFLLQTLSSFLLLKAFVSKRKIYLGHKNPEELCKMHSADYL